MENRVLDQRQYKDIFVRRQILSLGQRFATWDSLLPTVSQGVIIQDKPFVVKRCDVEVFVRESAFF